MSVVTGDIVKLKNSPPSFRDARWRVVQIFPELRYVPRVGKRVLESELVDGCDDAFGYCIEPLSLHGYLTSLILKRIDKVSHRETYRFTVNDVEKA